MKCPKCNKVYSEDNVYCVDCGTRLIDEKSDLKEGNPIERFSTRVKTSKPKDEPKPKIDSEVKESIPDDDKLDILIFQNRQLIKQNNRIIELLEKLAN